MKTGALWACSAALFLIAAYFHPVGILHNVAIVYCFLSVIKSGWES